MSLSYDPMNTIQAVQQWPLTFIKKRRLLSPLFSGLMMPLGFAPFHYPGLAILGIALLFAELLMSKTVKQSFITGFIFGVGFMGVGTSWIYVSIHAYGHLPVILSALITCVFIAYNAWFFSIMAALFGYLNTGYIRPLSKLTLTSNELIPGHRNLNSQQAVLSAFLFSSLWCLIEYFRANFLGGFPWLLLGFGQIDTSLANFLPIIGVYGVGFMTCFAATCLVMATRFSTAKTSLRFVWLAIFVAVLILPNSLNAIDWSHQQQKPLSVSVIQANLSMRDKWDETIFWKILKYYQKNINQLLGKKQLIVMPESAIPIPDNYVSDFINSMDYRAKKQGTSILFGIPQAASQDETEFYNSLISIGVGKGVYSKRHLVPFGEYIPQPFVKLINWISLPLANMKPGRTVQPLITSQHLPIATLICFELAFPELLRQQLPKAQWIVSISDDGWFGHSFAMHQQLQMAQTLSKLSARYQIVANNDGLSSIIDPQGHILYSLPGHSSGILNGIIYPADGRSPWVLFGDKPIIFFSMFVLLVTFICGFLKSSV